MKNAMFVLSTMGLALAAQTVLAQRDATSKISGSVYEAPYNAWTAGLYQDHAYDHAGVLQDYSSTNETVPREVVQEHTRAIRNHLQAAGKAYSVVGQSTKDDATARKHIASLIQHHQQAIESLDQLDKAAATGDADAATVQEHSTHVFKILKSAQQEHDALIDHLQHGQPVKADSDTTDTNPAETNEKE